MKPSLPHGLSTLTTHYAAGDHPHGAHVQPIYQTSTFGFEDAQTAADVIAGRREGFYYTRMANPNSRSLADAIARLEGLDLLRADSAREVAGEVFASGMAAISATMLSLVGKGGTIVAQQALYSGTYALLKELAANFEVRVVFVPEPKPQSLERALATTPGARVVYAESPVNPAMQIVDLAAAAEVAHRHGAWLVVDNTFATPYCQRPLALGADVVVHSTTKFLSGHGVVVGGAVVSPHVDFVRGPLHRTLRTLGGSPSPFDCWLSGMGLKTFELRMQRHCENAMAVARFLEQHPAVEKVHYPGLDSHPGHALAAKQMLAFGGMLSFELKGGMEAGVRLMERLRLITLAVSLGSVDSLIQHPASMTHAHIPREERQKMGIRDGLVRFSVGIENVEDILEDLEQALEGTI